jgi:hypothetical protein
MRRLGVETATGAREGSTRTDLKEDENIQRAARTHTKSTFMGLLIEGKLYLSDRRLIWEASWLRLPFVGPRHIEIELPDIEDCFIQGLAFTVQTRRQERVPFILMGALFYPLRRQATFDWRDAILEAIRRQTK